MISPDVFAVVTFGESMMLLTLVESGSPEAIGEFRSSIAGVLSGLLDGMSFAEAVRRGCATGALAVTCHGDFGGLPTRTQLEAFLQNRRPVER